MSELPTGWVKSSIGEVAESMKNGIYKPAEAYSEDGIACLRMYNVEAGKIVWKDIKRMVLSKEDFKMYRLLPGDLLVNRVNSRELVGKTAMIPAGLEPCVFESKNIRLRLLTKLVEPKFVAFKLLLDGSRHFANNAQQVVGMASISQPQLAAFPIPLPPLTEQKRIVAKIEELFSELEAGEESLRVARRQLGVYRQSLLKQAFEGKLTAKWRTQNPAKLESATQLLARIQSARQSRYEQRLEEWEAAGSGSNPKKPAQLEPFPSQELVGDFPLPAGWLVLSYGDLCSVIRNGISQKPSGDTGHKIARISAVRPMIFDYDDYRFIDCEDETAADYTLATGDLIFTRYNGARRFVGVCAQFKSHEPRLYPDKLIRTRPDLPQLDHRYLEIALNCGLSRAWLETKIRTTAGQSGVSGGDVKTMPVPICSLSEQQEIVRVLDEQFEVIERNEREIDAALKRSEALRQAILKKAFTGRLVPQVATDEPASALLARLRAERSSVPRKTLKSLV